MKVDFFTFNSAPKELKQEWREEISKVLELGQFIGGSSITLFEKEWSAYLKIGHTIGVGNGYDALVVALKALDVGPGDFVAVPSHTFIATWLAVAAVGAIPVGIDCDSNGLMDLSLLETESKIFSAVIPVHMHGQMVDMQRLMLWAKQQNIKVIEDCAQAHGAEIYGKKSGTWGDIGAFSFYPTKNLGAIGDAGAIVTNNAEIADRVRSIANYGSIPSNKYGYQYLGVNSRLDSIQAAVLSVNIKYLDSWNESRRLAAKKYSSGLQRIGIPLFLPTPESIFHHYISISENRTTTRSLLNSRGIATEIHYPESAEHNYHKIIKINSSGKSPRSKELAQKTISLPISPWINDSEIEYVLDQISLESIRRSFLGEI